jgi:hypothetical protein
LLNPHANATEVTLVAGSALASIVLDRYRLVPILLDVFLNPTHLPRRRRKRLAAEQMAVVVVVAAEKRDDQRLFEFGEDQRRKGGVISVEFPHDELDKTELCRSSRRIGAEVGRNSQWRVDRSAEQRTKLPGQCLRRNPDDEILEVWRVFEFHLRTRSANRAVAARYQRLRAVDNKAAAASERETLKKDIRVGKRHRDRGPVPGIAQPNIWEFAMVEMPIKIPLRAPLDVDRPHGKQAGQALTQFADVLSPDTRKPTQRVFPNDIHGRPLIRIFFGLCAFSGRNLRWQSSAALPGGELCIRRFGQIQLCTPEEQQCETS